MKPEDTTAAGMPPVEPPVRPSLADALDAWWEAAFAEGREGRTHDTEGGAAQKALQDIWAAHSAQLAAAVAAERERWAKIAKSHMDMAIAMGAKEKARTAASILAEGKA